MAATLPTFDPGNREHINRQLSAVVRFGEHLAENPPAHIDADLRDAIRLVLNAYRLELERLRTGEQPTAEFLRVMRWAKYMAIAVVELLLDAQPSLQAYDPNRPAATAGEASLHLLAHALAAFAELLPAKSN